MADLPISEQEWDAIGNRADTAARKALTQLALKAVRKHGSNEPIALVACGGARAVGELGRIGVLPERMHLVEEMLVAYLRGAVRGLDHPVHEDGRPRDGEVGHA
ncbi:hypothetical protein GXW78_07720 [Roseomonas terrae]|uniref:Uncharacterized protein n=1 Tax=Neoroseomonas terrae TaxID=424799 RepID=A0ABS5EEV2_9PROT|nr:hypothetical protein [Neoroseomonas terrae]MBR0649543.1 hypothetical protein [Neoroseomonas terrae]